MATGREPAAVLWDMDGTLLDTEKLWDIPLHEAVQRLGTRLSTADREALVGSNMDDTVVALLRHGGVEPTPERRRELAAWITGRVRALFAEPLQWRPGACGALRSAREAGWPSALVTSTQRELTELALHTLGRGNFDATVCGDEVNGRNKPDREPYAKAARLLGVDPAGCLAVEDSAAGSASARAAGCAVLLVPCDVPVQPGERTELRDSLADVDAAELATVFGALRSP